MQWKELRVIFYEARKSKFPRDLNRKEFVSLFEKHHWAEADSTRVTKHLILRFKIFDIVDLDKSGSISIEEFLIYFACYLAGTDEERLTCRNCFYSYSSIISIIR
jgi:hypothetical protein